jgi:hypothetical protein
MPKLTSMAKGIVVVLGAGDGRRVDKGLQGGDAGMAEATVLGSRGRSGHKDAQHQGHLQGVERPRAVTAKKSSLGMEILHRNTERVKFNKNTIISSKLSNRKEVFDDVRG